MGPPPPQILGVERQNCLIIEQALEANARQAPKTPFLGPRAKIQVWEEIGADQVLLTGIRLGVGSPLHQIPQKLCHRSGPVSEAVARTIQEYSESGVICPLPKEVEMRTKTWTPVFPRTKRGSNKVRIITDLRALNATHKVPRFKTDNWATVLEVLKQQDLAWGLTLDLKSFFHHLEVSPKIRRWMRFKIGPQAWEIRGMPFGWACSPWWAHKLARPIQAKLNQMGIVHVWYVDDVLIVGRTPQEVEHQAAAAIRLLTNLGIQVNQEKSMKFPAQKFPYLGQILDLETNKVHSQPEKISQATKMVRDVQSAKKVLPRTLAQVAGTLLDIGKRNARLHGLPRQLMKAAGLATHCNKTKDPGASTHQLWNRRVKITCNCRQTLRDIEFALRQPVPKVLRPPCPDKKFVIHSDASDVGWGGHLVDAEGREISAIARTWTPAERTLHITAREAMASAFTVMEFIPLIPRGAVLTVRSDSTPTVWAWRKGSRLRGMNSHIAKAFIECQVAQIFLESCHIPGTKNTRADWLSRNPDHHHYKLDPRVFHRACRRFGVEPTVDLFASRDNRQVTRFCSWRQDKMSLGDAFQLNWSQEVAWLNPPWVLYHRALNKLDREGGLALACVPVWRSAPWWTLVQKMAVAQPWIWRNTPLFQGPQREWLPPPKWATAFILLHGSGKGCARSRRGTTFDQMAVSGPSRPCGKKPNPHK